MEIAKKRIVNAAKWNVVAEIVAKIISPITTIVLARILAKEVFGIVASITTITSLADLLTDAGFNAYIVQHKFDRDEEKSKTFNVCFWSNLSISILLFFIIFIFRYSFSEMVGASGYHFPLVIAALVIPMTSVSSIEIAVMQKELDFKKIGIIKIICKTIPFVVTIPLAFLGFEFWSLIIGTIAGELCLFAFTLIFGPFKPKFVYSFKELKKISSFSIWAYLESILEWLLKNLVFLFIGPIFGIALLGVFKNGITIIISIVTATYALYGNVYKSSMAKAQANKEEFSNLLFNFQKFTSIISIPLGIGIFLFRSTITKVLLGSGWEEAETIIGLWGLIGTMSIAFGNFYSDAIRAKGKPFFLVLINTVYLTAIIVLLAFSKNISFETFCIVFCLIKLIQPILQIIVGSIVCKVSFWNVVQNDAPQFLSTCIMCFPVIVFKLNTLSFYLQLFFIFACIVIYFVCFLFLSPDKMTIINKVLKRRVSINERWNNLC